MDTNKKSVRIAGAEILKDVLAFLSGYQRENGYMPTLSEIGAHFGGKPKQWAYYYTRRLEREKKIKLTAGKHRGIVLK